MAIDSMINRGVKTLVSLARRSHIDVKIDLIGGSGLVKCFSAGDHIKGTVTITSDHDLPFDEVRISLEGISETMLDRTAYSGPTVSQQLFLKLCSPVQDFEYPDTRILQAGRSYKFPFRFTVPSRLLPQVCEHESQGMHVHQSHSTPPPTLGNPIMVCDAQRSLDDMAPATVGITYYIRSILVKSTTDHQSLANVCKKVHIVPASRKEPTLDLANYPLSRFETEKSLRRGAWCSTRGRLSASSVQPNPIAMATSASEEPYNSNNTAVIIQLKFNPSGNAQPPQLSAITSTIHANTFYMSKSPHQETDQLGNKVGRTLYSHSVPLSTVSPALLKWTKHTRPADVTWRRDSNDSEDSNTGVGCQSGQTWYTASVVVPVTLPQSKVFVPTFHSCLVSRTYSVEVSLSYDTVVAKALSPKISLRLPVQIVTQNKSIEAMQTSLHDDQLHVQSDGFDAPHFSLPAYEIAPDGVKLPGYSERVTDEVV